ncbi:mitogen-activated protein kinase kinase kinase kinase 4-like isoform X1 [Balamuthia mandrillaris]
MEEPRVVAGTTIILATQSKEEERQLKIFTNWTNFILARRGLKVNSIATDTDDGIILIVLYEILTEDKLLSKFHRQPKLLAQKVNNVTVALQAFKQAGVPVTCSATDIICRRVKSILGLFWVLIAKFQLGKYVAGQTDSLEAKQLQEELVAIGMETSTMMESGSRERAREEEEVEERRRREEELERRIREEEVEIERRRKEEEERRRRLEEEREREQQRKLQEEAEELRRIASPSRGDGASSGRGRRHLEEQSREAEARHRLEIERLRLAQLQLNEKQLREEGEPGVKTFIVREANKEEAEELCEICELALSSGRIVLVDDKDMYHLNCFVCTQCGCTFHEFYWEWEGKPLCRPHYLVAAGLVCAKCGDTIGGGKVIAAMGKKWHPTCFTCTVCDCTFSEGHYTHEGLPYCKSHYMEVKGLLCARCGGALGSGDTKALGKGWHRGCFVCDVCEGPFGAEGFFEWNGKPVCKTDYRKLKLKMVATRR